MLSSKFNMAVEVVLKNEFLKFLHNVQIVGSILFLVPYLNKSKLALVGVYTTWFLIFGTSIQLMFTLCLTVRNIMDISDVAPQIGGIFMASIKYMKIHTNAKTYNTIIDHYRGNFWNLLPEHSENNLKTLNNYLKKMRIIVTILQVYVYIFTIMMGTFPLSIMVYENKILGKNVQYLLPIDAWYPFDKVKWYTIVYIWECIMFTIAIGAYSFANIIHVSFIACICLELKLLGCWMEELVSPSDIVCIKEGPGLKRHKRIHMKFNMIAKRYNFLYE